MFRNFHGKVILFGEYTILHGSKALAEPLKPYFGHWIIKNDKRIAKWFEWLISQDIPLDKDQLEYCKEIYSFSSNIPIGCGLGSSGALVAATFARFALNHKDASLELFAKMESFFHGSSSGLDPYISYKNESTLISSGKVESDLSTNMGLNTFLFNSNTPRTTAELVEWYKHERLNNKQFKKLSDEMADINNEIIDSIIENKVKRQLDLIKELSLLQFQFLNKLIPSHVQKIWKEGLNSQDYFMKICGAGGGGCFLLFSQNELIEVSGNPILRIKN